MEQRQEVQSDKPSQNDIEVKLEKLSLKSTGNYIGIGIILYLVLTMVLIVSIQLIYRMNGLYDYNINMSEFSYLDPVSYFLMISIVGILSLFLSFFLVLRLSKHRLSDVIKFNKLDGKSMFSWVLVGLSTTVCANYVAVLLQNNLEAIGITPELPSTPYANGIIPFFMSVVAVAIVPAIMEEFVFRGVVLGMLRKFGDGFAIIASAAIFGIVHGNVIQSAFAFIVGIILGYIVIRTNSLLPGIIIHLINNFRSLLVPVFSYNLGNDAGILFEEISSIVFAFIGIIGLVYLLKKDKNMFLISESYSPLSVTKRFNYLTVNAGMIVSLIICIIMMVK